MLKDASKKEYYLKKAKKLKLPNAYTAAITDYMRSPKVTKSFTEQQGTHYNVDKKGFALKKVEVFLRNQSGTVPVTCTTHSDEWSFMLTPIEQQQGVYIQVADSAGQQVLLSIL